MKSKMFLFFISNSLYSVLIEVAYLAFDDITLEWKEKVKKVDEQQKKE